MPSAPHRKANLWLGNCKDGFNTKTNLVWLNLILEKHFGFIPDQIWQMVCRFLGDGSMSLSSDEPYLTVLEGLNLQLPLLAMSGPLAMETAANDKDPVSMTTLVPAFRFKKMFGFDDSQVNPIESTARSLSNAIRNKLPDDQITALENKLQEWINQLNSMLAPSSSRGAPTSTDTTTTHKDRLNSTQEAHASQLPKLLQLINSHFDETTSHEVHDPNDIPVEVRWVSPAASLQESLDKEGIKLPSMKAMERAIQLLGLEPYNDPGDDTVPDSRFLLHFEVTGEFRRLIRKPTQFSGGSPRIYATYRDNNKNHNNPVQGFGRTVDLQDCKTGVMEAIAPNALVAAMATKISVLGVLPPFEVNNLIKTLEDKKFVENATSHRLADLGVAINDLHVIENSRMKQDLCNDCSPKCY